jgi:hypothetical protein
LVGLCVQCFVIDRIDSVNRLIHAIADFFLTNKTTITHPHSKLCEEGSPWAGSPEQERLAGAMQRLKAKAEELKAAQRA